MLVVHVVLCWIVGGFPSFYNWLIYIGGGILGTLLGEYLCMREESKEIRLGATKEEREMITEEQGQIE